MKKIIILLTTIFVLFSCNNTVEENKTTEIKEEAKKEVEKLHITTSIVPLASIANYIGGEYVEVKSLVPSGVSPHGFDLKASQMIDIEKSSLIVYLGLDHIDGFLDKAIKGKNNLLDVKEGINLLESEEHHHDDHDDLHEHEEHKGDSHEEDSHSYDPHIWGSSDNAYIIAKSILNKLVEISPENKEYFEKNLESFKNEISLIKKDFEEKIKDKKQTNFIIFHDAYNYLFEELNIESDKKHIFRKNMLNDPNSAEMKNLTDKIKELGIKVVFKEPQLDSSNLKNMSIKHSIEINILNPLGNDGSSKGYIENYKNNLESLIKIYE